MELSQRALPVFGWAAIALGIGPHSSYSCLYDSVMCYLFICNVLIGLIVKHIQAWNLLPHLTYCGSKTVHVFISMQKIYSHICCHC